jgi:putative DNA primase/helicase
MFAADFALLIKDAERSGSQWSGRCPAHDDQRASLSFRDSEDRVLVNCHKSCSFQAITAAVGLKPSDFFHTSGAPSTPMAGRGAKTAGTGRAKSRPRVVAKTYDYRDEQGNLIFQVVREEPKGFFQRRLDEHGRWINNIKGLRRVIYRLPEIIDAMKRRASGDRIVVVVEGEKDADNLWALDIPSTTNAMGAKKWSDAYTRQLVAAGVERVVILPDKDRNGEEHALMVARSCLSAGLNVKIVRLPNLPAKGDVTDWLDAGNSREALLEAFAAAGDVVEGDLGPGTSGIPTLSVASRTDNRLDKPMKFHQTDLGNAERLVAKFGPDIRYTDEAGWLVWDGQRWALDPGSSRLMHYASLTVRSMYMEAGQLDDHGARQTLVNHARQSEARPRLEAIVALTKHRVTARLRDFDRDPYLLNVSNGTIDLKTGVLRPHRKEDLVTKLAPVEYDAAAEAPTWDQFLKEIMNGVEALVRFLQLAVGYSLTGLTIEQVLFILYGTGANGKSTLLTIISEALGDYAMATPVETLLIKRDGAISNDVARLVGARFVTASEVADNRRLDESLVKQLTGGDPITARFLHREFFEFTPSFKLFLAANHTPRIRGTDEAIWRRIRLIPFEVTIPERQRDKKLLEKLRPELPGILAWAVRGCLDWQASGDLEVPGEVRVATAAYRAEEDVIAGFLEDCCFVAPHLKVRSSDLYAAYIPWCKDMGEAPCSQKLLGRQLSERGFVPAKAGTRFWRGLGLRAERHRENRGDDRDHPDRGSGSSRKQTLRAEKPQEGPDHPHGPHHRRGHTGLVSTERSEPKTFSEKLARRANSR